MPRRRAPLAPLLLLLPLVAQCAAGARATRPDAGAPPAAATERTAAAHAAAARPLGLALAPDPALQRLVEPRARGDGPAWLGGDVALSVQVAPRRFAWLFGDTLLGSASRDCPPPRRWCERRMASDDPDESVLANSAGLMRFDARGAPSPLEFFWRDESTGPAPVFATADAEEIVWPLAAAPVGKRLLVALSVHRRETGLAPLANLFAVVDDPAQAPDRWRWREFPVPGARTGADATDPLTWTTALVVDGPWVVVFGQRGVGFEARTVLSRMRLDGIGEPGWEPRPEVLLAGGVAGEPFWDEGGAAGELYEVPGLPGTSEASFEWREDLGWVTFRVPPLGFDVRVYTAPALHGPWADRGAVYRIPPPWSTAVRTDCLWPEAGCGQERFAAYAARSHPELAPAGGFALSYNVNLLAGTLKSAEETAEELDDFYVPQLLAGTIPP